jgi:foldase protein PrsA
MSSPFMKTSRALVGVLFAGLAAAAVTGCGDDVPSDAVAKVGDTVITQEQFDHWYDSAAKSQAQAGGPTVAPDPPTFEKCAAGLEAQQPKGTAAQKESDLKKQCKQGYEQLKQQVMQFLIQSEWVQQEAEDQGIEATDAEVRRQFEQQKKQAFPKPKAYAKFLRESGASERDLLFRIKLDVLQTKLTEKIQKAKPEISDEEIEKYFEENEEQLSPRDRVDVNLVLTKTKAKADQARKEIEGGASWKEVSTKYSIDQASKAQGGKLENVPTNQQGEAFDKAVFGSKEGELEGPVKTDFGYYVFEVTKFKEGKEITAETAEGAIRQTLEAQKQGEALQKFIEEFREDFKDQTKCREGFIVAECSNAPKEETETGPASGGTPGQPAPQAPTPEPGAAPTPQQTPPPAP